MTPPPPQVNGEAIYSSSPWRVQFDSADKKTWYTTSKVSCLCSEVFFHHIIPSFITLAGREERICHYLWLCHSWYASSRVSTRPLVSTLSPSPSPSPPPHRWHCNADASTVLLLHHCEPARTHPAPDVDPPGRGGAGHTDPPGPGPPYPWRQVCLDFQIAECHVDQPMIAAVVPLHLIIFAYTLVLVGNL